MTCRSLIVALVICSHGLGLGAPEPQNERIPDGRALEALEFRQDEGNSLLRIGGNVTAAGEEGQDSRNCPPCEDLFSKLETSVNGKRIQETHLQLRGGRLVVVVTMMMMILAFTRRQSVALGEKRGEKSCQNEDRT